MTIDERLKRLEEMTKRLEADDLPLEEAITLFEEGIALAKGIKSDLEQAKLKVKKVIEEAKGTFSLSEFDLS